MDSYCDSSDEYSSVSVSIPSEHSADELSSIVSCRIRGEFLTKVSCDNAVRFDKLTNEKFRYGFPSSILGDLVGVLTGVSSDELSSYSILSTEIDGIILERSLGV